ncbi:uncharacterized protein LOC134201270 [Bombyx mori]|uniref:uncharacterized protein LOC134201270 n=1 Tax=Bombyx mori TaxID=7091 RepID=UPI002ED245A5
MRRNTTSNASTEARRNCAHFNEATTYSSRTILVTRYPSTSNTVSRMKYAESWTTIRFRSDSVRYKLRMPVWPNETGDFGRVGRTTHWKYVPMRIQEDLKVTSTPGVRDWNLPEALRPEEGGAGTPNRNCLGWARAATLTNDQVAFLESANVMEDAFPVKFSKFQYSTDLYEKVSLALSKTEEKIKIIPQTKKNAEGAIAQVCWIQVENTDQDTSPNNFYCESRNNQVVTSSELDARQILASLILSFRVQKDQIGETRPYSVYAFGNYRGVPDTWHSTRNTVFNDGRADRWNVKEYTAPFTDKSDRYIIKRVTGRGRPRVAPSAPARRAGHRVEGQCRGPRATTSERAGRRD